MRFVLCVILFALAVVLAWTPPTPQTFWFTQTLDHFNSMTQPSTYQQRYLIYDGYFKKAKGRIFFYTGNEGPIDSFYGNSGFVFEAAQKFDALVVFAEHRYYGQSLPFGNNSWQADTVGYLSIDQALADYAVLLEYIVHTQYNFTVSPTIVSFGGSYGGILAAWFRIAYPHICDAALAASAPIPVTTGYTPKPGYFETVTDDFAAIDARCPDIARQAFAQVLQLAQSSDGLRTLTQKFSLCNPLKSNQVQHLIGWAINSFGTLAMLDYPYPTNFLAPLPGFPIRLACETLLNYSSDPLYALGQAAGLFYNGTSGSLTCFDIYQEFIECADPTGCGTGNDALSWDYQMCTEITYFPSTNNVTDMFPPRSWTSSNLTAYCQKTWNTSPRLDWLRTRFGGKRIESASNIIFSNGLLDPWHGGGFLKSVNPTLPAILIPDGAHHLDLRHSDPNDPASVTVARKQEIQYLAQFIEQTERRERGSN